MDRLAPFLRPDVLFGTHVRRPARSTPFVESTINQVVSRRFREEADADQGP